MNSHIVNNLFERILAVAPDPEVGIKVGYLSGSEKFSLFGAEIGPQKVLSAHYHEEGEEIYLILDGEGVMRLGDLDADGKVIWDPPFRLTKGDCFTVGAGKVHCLCNNSDSNMVAVFGCPKNHLSTDRVIVERMDD